jgi:hypothetical protein
LAFTSWIHLARKEGRVDDGNLNDAEPIERAILHVEQTVRDSSVAFNRAIRRRWRV